MAGWIGLNEGFGWVWLGLVGFGWVWLMDCDGWMHGIIDILMDGYNGWMDGWMDGRKDCPRYQVW